jgi:hypothetical protein
VGRKIDGTWQDHDPENPVGVIVHAPGHELHGKIIMSDGNHRVASSLFQGKEHILMRVATVHIHPNFMKEINK